MNYYIALVCLGLFSVAQGTLPLLLENEGLVREKIAAEERGAREQILDDFEKVPADRMMRCLDTGNKQLNFAVEMLEEGRRNVNYRDQVGDFVLSFVALSGNKQAIQLLVGAGALINQTGGNDWTALHRVATHTDTLRAIQVLLGLGASADMQDSLLQDTPLHLAARLSGPEEVAVLAKASTKINMKNSCEETALAQAARMCRPGVVRVLVAYGASIELAVSPYGDYTDYILSVISEDKELLEKAKERHSFITDERVSSAIGLIATSEEQLMRELDNQEILRCCDVIAGKQTSDSSKDAEWF